MRCKKDLLAKTRLRIKGREGLQTVRTKCTLFYVNPAIQILCKAIVNKILDVTESEIRCDLRKEISNVKIYRFFEKYKKNLIFNKATWGCKS